MVSTPDDQRGADHQPRHTSRSGREGTHDRPRPPNRREHGRIDLSCGEDLKAEASCEVEQSTLDRPVVFHMRISAESSQQPVVRTTH